MNFGTALDQLKDGKKVTRLGWTSKGLWLKLVKGESFSTIKGYEVYDPAVDDYILSPWIGLKAANDQFVPWACSQTDVLAEDWEIAD